MLRTFAALRHQSVTKRKSPKVADETMFSNLNTDHASSGMPICAAAHHELNHTTTTATTNTAVGSARQQAWHGLSLILRIPISILSCFSHQHANAADAIWVTRDQMLRTSDIDHLMINDSMRYAILM